MPTQSLLAARKLSKAFGDVQAVDDFSLTVQAGEVVGLLGPNGAGKTTMLRMIAGILTPDQGSVEIDGINMAAHPLEAKAKLGFLTGDTQLYRRLTPREVLFYFGRLYEVAEDTLAGRVEELIRRLEISEFADRQCQTLSSGQKQRANIARAFLHDPPVVVLDEPTNALDIVSGRFIVEEIRRQRQSGKAILFSTHIMSEAEYLCDRIALIHKGRRVEEGSKEEIIARSGLPTLTDAFLEAIGERSGHDVSEAPCA